MAGRRSSERTRQVRTPERRRADLAHNLIDAALHGQVDGTQDGISVPSADYRFGVMLPFGKATFRLGSLMPVGSTGVHVPSQVDVDFSRDRSAPVRTLKIEVRQGIPICTEIHLAARPDGRGLRTSDLEAIDLANWVQDILSECSFQVTPDGLISQPGTRDSLKAIEYAQKAGRRKVTPELLQRVAEVYRAHIDAKPIDAICDEFDVSYRTAARYVELCRTDEFGLLPKTHKGKRKA
jgi:hypothetical protein